MISRQQYHWDRLLTSFRVSIVEVIHRANPLSHPIFGAHRAASFGGDLLKVHIEEGPTEGQTHIAFRSELTRINNDS